VVLPVFVDIESFANEKPRFSLHEKYPQFNFIALMVGSLVSVKNVDTALEAFTALVKTYMRAGLVIVGDGPDRKRLEARVRELGIEGHVVFAGFQEELVSYYKTADAFLHTSRYEGYCRVLVEAAAAGKPIVSTQVGIVGGLLRDEKEALVCPVGDKACVAVGLGRLVEDNRLRSFLGVNAHSAVFRASPANFDEYLSAMRASFDACIGGE
jgi:glycosyltransferase involved in cell wall biosynthesis